MGFLHSIDIQVNRLFFERFLMVVLMKLGFFDEKPSLGLIRINKR